MTDFKEEISVKISESTGIEKDEIKSYIEIPKDTKNGDYAFPCFKLAKVLKKAPQVIAEEIKNKMNTPECIKKVEIAGGYLNFYIKNNILIKDVLEQVEKKDKYGTLDIGKGKNVIIEYSSPNIAKPFHIGHLKTTVIGGALYNVYKYLGYNVIGMNYLGDYGTQFGKLIEGYKRWGNEYEFKENPIDDLSKIYVRINNLCKEDENVLNQCRENFKLLENGDEYCTSLWEEFRKLSIVEFKKIYDLLGSKFDSFIGEAFAAKNTGEVVKLLEKSGRLEESEGAKIVDLSEQGIDTPCMILKSDGSSIYASRDLASILYRAKTYDYDKSLYVTSYEQNLHFKQVFEVAKLLGLDRKYTDGLEHVAYGMIRLTTGKMSTRQGNFVKVEDLLNEAIEEAKKVIEEKNPNLENKEEVAKKVGIGAVIFNDLSISRVKDEIFDIKEMLNFQGETGPYIQYTYVRTKSVIDKAGGVPDFNEINIDVLNDEYSINNIKLISNFENILGQVVDKSEPSILSKYLIDLSKAYSSFYNENKIICDDKEIQNARVFLSYAVGKVLKQGAELLGIKMPEKM